MSSQSPATALAAARPLDWLLLTFLASIWGASFLFIKIAVVDVTPMTLVALRLAIAAVVMALVARALGARLPSDLATWRQFAVIAFVGNLIPFWLITWGEQEIDSGLAAILMATMPLATVLLAHFFTPDDRLTPTKLAGMLLGFSGILILVGWEALTGLGSQALAQLATAFAATCYAVSSVFVRASGLSRISPLATSTGVLLVSAALALPLAFLLENPLDLRPSGQSMLAIAALAILSTALAYQILFRLLARNGATFMALNNYLVPLFGVMWGALVLAERPEPRALGALLLIFAGIALSQWRPRR
ncbi:MAG: DMT family transporter [Kiloniellales bacterium]